MNRNRREYERRVNRVVDYIGEHLADELSLERLAQIAAFSPYHFHRIFKSVADETLFEFIQRLRIEKGAQALLFLPDRSVLEIALHCGFASAATFARAFKSHFGMSATAWRAGGNGKKIASRAKRFARSAKTPPGATRILCIA